MNFLESNRLVLFYDGYCNLCSNLTQFVKDIDSKGLINYAPLQSPFVKEFLSEQGLDTTNINTVVCAVNGTIYTKSTAVIKIMQHLSGLWSTAEIFLLIPQEIRDSVYDLVASNRYQWFGYREECFIPQDNTNNSSNTTQKNSKFNT